MLLACSPTESLYLHPAPAKSHEVKEMPQVLYDWPDLALKAFHLRSIYLSSDVWRDVIYHKRWRTSITLAPVL